MLLCAFFVHYALFVYIARPPTSCELWDEYDLCTAAQIRFTETETWGQSIVETENTIWIYHLE